MKWNKQWRRMTRDQRTAWRAWARDNRVLLDSGDLRHVSGQKAFTLVSANRALAGDSANPTAVPTPANWLTGIWTLAETGPFTAGVGTMNLRVLNDIVTPSRWFVWATKPLPATESDPQRWLRFVKSLPVAVIATDELTDNFAPDYRAVLGSFNGPGENGAWPTEHYVWMRVHQYANGQLGPAVVLKGRIQVEL